MQRVCSKGGPLHPRGGPLFNMRRCMSEVNIIERAFQLAPECKTVVEVRNRLSREGYLQVDAHLSGRTIKAEIKQRLSGDTLS